MELDEEKRTVEVPGYLRKKIDSDPKGLSSPSPIRGIGARDRWGEKPETREKRIAAMMDALRKNQRKG